MKLFPHRELRSALAHAAAGGQALLVHAWGGPSRYACFDGAAEIGKLFDQNRARLAATAQRLGVRRIKVDRPGQPGQHVDLVGGPLAKAKQEATAS
ncbi:hypothetical protein G3N56_07955 [Desulfovibrio sulfodismutans]|uniref:Uncharacterized protein n=1 Tax=Desulfolutivibrio sulfodismutans TaxID=63561 RepID=A0A7K3NKE8_9BACT|nr:hypothetical protein [Desulfolutivibrio sulfodismutans]NDY56676.1 hypothetical protein [Desulfolutivibrio sulfodismutans]QLA11223.1 hypothetical protein GD606_02500 [Desulfolutivibrio sulfodismutans DSM 3696]